MAKKKQATAKKTKKRDKLEKDLIQEKKLTKEELHLISENVRKSLESDKELSDLTVNWAAGQPGKSLKWLSTGLYALDIALGGKGLAMGRTIEIWGPPQCGKTTLSMHLIKMVQEQYGLMGAYLETESKSVQPEKRAKDMGLDIDLFDSYCASFGESLYRAATTFVKTPGYGIVVIDSVATLIPKKEYEGNSKEAGLAPGP